MRDRYTFPAIFEANEYGIAIEFPDLPGCLTCADTVEEALRNAREAMELHLYSMETGGEEIPEPSDLFGIETARNQRAIVVDAWMPLVRLDQRNKAVKKTLTIPAWLEAVAEEKHVNFSRVLQDALKDRLGVDDRGVMGAPPARRRRKGSDRNALA